MSYPVRLIGRVVLWCLFVLVAVTSFKASVVGGLIEPVVLIVLIFTLIRGPMTGLWMAASAGWIYDSVTIWPAGSHIFALLFSVVAVAAIVRFWLTERSGASFFFLIPVGTLAYGLALSLIFGISKVVSPDSLVPDWSIFIRTLAIQTVVHAALGLLALRLRGSRYSQAHGEHQF